MDVIPPLTGASPSITDAMLTSSTVAESEAQWVSGATYVLGAVRRGPSGPYQHRLFESLQPNNMNHPVTDTEWWLDIGPSNRWAMFDLLRNTGTVGVSPLVVEITPGRRINAVGLAGIVADDIVVEAIVGGVVVKTLTQNLSTRVVADWYQYFFAEFTFLQEVAFFGLPPDTSAMVRVTATRAAGDVTIGALIIGTAVFLGDVEPSAEDDAQNFSKINRDDFGNVELIPRRSLPRTNQVLWAEKGVVATARAVRDILNAVPAMWVGLADPDHPYFASLLILGIYIRFTIKLDYEEMVRIDLELEET